MLGDKKMTDVDVEESVTRFNEEMMHRGTTR